jgi:hypothetical protein
MADFLRPKGRGYGLDFKAAAEAGALGLIKRYAKTDKGVSVELYDAQAALVQLGRYHKLFTDRLAISDDDIDWSHVPDDVLDAYRIGTKNLDDVRRAIAQQPETPRER